MSANLLKTFGSKPLFSRSVWGKLGVALGAAIFVELLLWVWALWPLFDPRFDWKPYFDEQVGEKRCLVALGLAHRAIQLSDVRGVDAAKQLAHYEWCPDAQKLFAADNLAMLERLYFVDRKPRARTDWGSGWAGRWRALPYIFSTEIPSIVDRAERHHGVVFGLAGLPWEIPQDLRCNFALVTDGASDFYLMRASLIVAGHKELALTDWAHRTSRCGA